jgi:hypothetical protein
LYADLAAIISPIFVSAALGFFWERLRRPFDTTFVTALVTTVGTPCLVGATLTRVEIDPQALGTMAGAAILAFLGFVAIGVVVLRGAGLPLHSYLPALIFPNAGNMGLPLNLFAFGETGLAFAIVFFTVFSVLQFTLGVGIAAGSFAPGRLLRLPLIYAVAASLVFMATGTPVPAWLSNTLDLLGGLTIPLMLVALGVSLARLRVRNLGRSLVLSLVRLGIGVVTGLALAWALDLSGAARGVLILQCAMPVAVFNYLFAQLYHRQPEEVAGMVVISTAISFATLPLLLLLVL